MTDLSKVLADVEPESKLVSRDENELEIDTTEIVLENSGSELTALDTESMKIDLTDQEDRKSITDSLLKNSDLTLDSILANNGDLVKSLTNNIENDIKQQDINSTHHSHLNNTSHNDSKLAYNLHSSANDQGLISLTQEAKLNIEKDNKKEKTYTADNQNSIERENCKNKHLDAEKFPASENCKNTQTQNQVTPADQAGNHLNEKVHQKSNAKKQTPKKEDLRLTYVANEYLDL